MSTPCDKSTKAAELRRRAEERLQIRPADPHEPLSEVEMRRLVHELQVHQIELEMQNEELRDVRTELEVALARHTDFYDFAPVGFITLTRGGAIALTNLTGAHLLGRERAALRGKFLEKFIAASERRAFSAFLHRAFATDSRQSCELTLENDGQTARIVQINARRSPDEQECRMVLVNITERKRVEEALRIRENQLAGIIGSAMDGIITVDEEQKIILFNSAAERLFGYSRAQVTNQSLDMLLPEPDRTRHRSHIQGFATTGITTRKMGSPSPVVGRRSNGDVFPVEASISQIEISGQRFFTAIVRDISKRLRAEKQMREDAERMRVLSHRLLQAQETERRHLARELHDEIGQVLSAVSLNLKIVKTKVDPAALPRLEESIQIVDVAIDQVRNLSLDLRPSVLDDFGLASALRWYVDRLKVRTGLRVHLAAEPHDSAIPADVRNACFRVAQEALTNVVRHASAQEVWVDLVHNESEIELTIRDDGKGFDLAAALARASRGGSFGLLGMKERIELLDGKSLFQSEPGKGTTIQIRLPWVDSAPRLREGSDLT
jgi:PAS domain S-box-containing protein